MFRSWRRGQVDEAVLDRDVRVILSAIEEPAARCFGAARPTWSLLGTGQRLTPTIERAVADAADE